MDARSAEMSWNEEESSLDAGVQRDARMQGRGATLHRSP